MIGLPCIPLKKWKDEGMVAVLLCCGWNVDWSVGTVMAGGEKALSVVCV